MSLDWRIAREWVRRHGAAVAAALAVLLLLVWLVLGRSGEAEEEETPAVVAVQTAVARVIPFPVVLSALGTVIAQPGHSAEVAAPAATRVMRVFVGPGQQVAAGQPLIALDESVWAAQTRQAETSFLAAQQAYERATRLVEQGVLPRKDAETSAAELGMARSALVEARLRQSLGVLRSPIAGVVTNVHAALSQSVDAGQTLVEVVDPAALEVLFHLSPGESATVPIGAKVQLVSGPDSTSVLVGTGEVSGVNAAVDSTTGSVDVRAAVTAPARLLKVGESVTGRITVGVHPRAVVVPESALVPADEGFQLFVVDAQSVAHATPVAVGARGDAGAEITAGLKGGETVVADGAYGVIDGARVQPSRAP
jgi:RND family efflux transporter MFP subunit